MKWVDYREKLGIGFNDSQKFKMLSNILRNYAENVVEASYSKNAYLNYCQMVGEVYYDWGNTYRHLSDSFGTARSIEELIAKYIAFYNTYTPGYGGYENSRIEKAQILTYLKKTLENNNIKYEILEDEDGTFIFPLGAKEFDDALISEPLEWLKDYPKARKTYVIALQQYSDGQYIRDVADNLRKAFEEFLKEFLGNNNDLNKNKKEVEAYLKSQNAAPQLISMLVSLISHYYMLNNEVAKHNDKMDDKYLEFLLYQIGIFIRMLVITKNETSSI